MGQFVGGHASGGRKIQALEDVSLAYGQLVDVDDAAVRRAFDAERVALEGAQDLFGRGAPLGDGSVGLDPLPVAALDEMVAHQGDEHEVDECFDASGIL